MPYHLGASEPFVGRALQGGWRDKVKIATKMPHWNVHSRGDMDSFLSVQMANLRTDRIDYYLVHNLQARSWKKLKDLGVADFIDAALRDGKIRSIGFSYHGGKDDFRAIVDDYPWQFCQLQINYLDTENQAGLEGMKYAAGKGLGIIAMEPLRGGMLAQPAAGRIQPLWDAAETRRTPAEWALRWVWDLPEVTLALSGMNEERHIEENLRIAGDALPRSLSDAERGIVEGVSAAWRQSLKVGCTGCRYCMPCPSGVLIPGAFQEYNNVFLGGPKTMETPRMKYLVQGCGLFTGTTPGFASQCTECNKCVSKCPQHLQIPALLKDVTRRFEGPGTGFLLFAIRGFLRLDGWRTRRKAARRPSPARC
jgi:uncharacterized protein